MALELQNVSTSYKAFYTVPELGVLDKSPDCKPGFMGLDHLLHQSFG